MDGGACRLGLGASLSPACTASSSAASSGTLHPKAASTRRQLTHRLAPSPLLASSVPPSCAPQVPRTGPPSSAFVPHISRAISNPNGQQRGLRTVTAIANDRDPDTRFHVSNPILQPTFEDPSGSRAQIAGETYRGTLTQPNGPMRSGCNENSSLATCLARPCPHHHTSPECPEF